MHATVELIANTPLLNTPLLNTPQPKAQPVNTSQIKSVARSFCLALEFAHLEGDTKSIADQVKKIIPASALQHEGLNAQCYLSSVQQAIDHLQEAGMLHCPRSVNVPSVAGQLLKSISMTEFRTVAVLRAEVKTALTAGWQAKKGSSEDPVGEPLDELDVPQMRSVRTRTPSSGRMTHGERPLSRSEAQVSEARAAVKTRLPTAATGRIESETITNPFAQVTASPAAPPFAQLSIEYKRSATAPNDSPERDAALSILHDDTASTRDVLRAAFHFLTNCNDREVTSIHEISPTAHELMKQLDALKSRFGDDQHICTMFCDEVATLLTRAMYDSELGAGFEPKLLERINGFLLA